MKDIEALSMSSSVIEQGGKILLPRNLKEQLGMNDGDEVDIEIFGSSLLIRPKGIKPGDIYSLKGCVQDNETDPLTLKSMARCNIYRWQHLEGTWITRGSQILMHKQPETP